MQSKSLIQFSVDGLGCVPYLKFSLRPKYVGVMAVMVTAFKRTYCSMPQLLGLLQLVPLTPQQATIDPCLHHRLLRHSQASLAQSLVGSLLLSPGSWYAQGFVCALEESVSPVLWKFCNQIPLAFKVKFPGGSPSLCHIPRLGNLLWVLQLSQQCENFFGIIVLRL